MAEGEWGVGRLAEPEEIAARVAQLLAPGSLAGRRVLVTAGGTREPLDSVRFLGNRSSGRMGVALAEEARRRGAEVILLAANLAVPAPHGVEAIPTPTAETMLDAALALPDVDVAPARGRGRRLPPGRGARRQAAEGRSRLDGRARADRRHRTRARRAEARRPGARRVRRRARRGGPRAEARDARDEERRSRRLQRRRPHRHRLRRGRERGRPDHARRRARCREAVEAALSPPRSSTRSRGCSSRSGRDGCGRGDAAAPAHRPLAEADAPDRRAPVVVTLVHELAALLRADRRRHRPSRRAGRGARRCRCRTRFEFVRQPPGLGSADAVVRARAEPPLPGRSRPTPCSSRGRSTRFAGDRGGRSDGAHRLVARRRTARRSGTSARVSHGHLDPLPGRPPYELQHVFRRAADAGAAVSAIQVGRTRDLTSPVDVVRENFPYLR